jgi:hypothetical protein
MRLAHHTRNRSDTNPSATRSPHTRWKRLGAASAGIALVVMPLAACGGPTKDWRFQGHELIDVDQTLETLTTSFKDSVASDGEGEADAVTVPDKAACYFQITNDTTVGETALCGPVKFLGEDENSWIGADVKLGGTKKKKSTIVAADSGSFYEAELDDKAELKDAKGKSPDADMKIDAPPAPKAEAGTTYPADESATLDDDPVVVSTPDATYTFTALGVTDHMGEGRDRTDPPEGGSFVTVGMERSSVSEAPNGQTSGAKLTVGGDEVEIPEEGATIAIAGDASDATVDVEYDGNVQQVSLKDQKVTDGHPYTDQTYSPVNAPQEELIGDENKGASTSYTFGVDAEVSSWDEKNSWAPDGKDRLTMDIAFDESSNYTEKDTIGSLSYDEKTSYTVKDLKVTVDGKDVKVDTDKIKVGKAPDDDWGAKEHQFTVTADVPTGAKEIKVSGTVKRSGTYAKSSGNEWDIDNLDNEPKTIDNDLKLKEVTLQPGEDEDEDIW